MLDLEHPAPAEGQGGRQRRSRAAGAGSRTSALRSAASSAAGVAGSGRRVGAHAACSSSVGFLGGLSSAGWPVSARNTSSRLGWPSEKSAIPTPDARQLGDGLGGPVGVGARRRQRRRVGLEVHGAELAREHPLGLGSLLGIEQPHVQRARADRCLELAGRALGDHLAVVDHGDPVGELVGLVEVLRAEQDRGALADERADDVPDLVARARVEPGGRLVEEHQLRRDDEARGDVEPPPHAAGVVLDQPAGRLGEAECLEQLGRARLGVGALQPQQAAEQDQVLAPGEVLVDRGELAGQADRGRAPRRPRRRCRARARAPSRRRGAAASRASGSWSSCRRRSGRARRTRSRCARRGRRRRPPGCRRTPSRGPWPRSRACHTTCSLAHAPGFESSRPMTAGQLETHR